LLGLTLATAFNSEESKLLSSIKQQHWHIAFISNAGKYSPIAPRKFLKPGKNY
jgi:hypothetical protein